MNHHILVIGGGLAGCTAALELAKGGNEVTILEKSIRIGGKVRDYGCKATDRCNNCGLCIAGDLWKRVEEHEAIGIETEARLTDIKGSRGNFSVTWKNGRKIKSLEGIDNIIVAAGFEEASRAGGSLEYGAGSNIITGRKMEELLLNRTGSGIFEEAPKSIAFIQCFGSRDVQEKASYCSRVCCGYSTRMARVIRKMYPETEIVFFYMDLQRVEAGEYFQILSNEGIEFIRCRPVKVKAGKPCRIQYEKPGTGAVEEKDFDMIILTEGIHPSSDAEQLAEICMLKVDGNGFLKYVNDPQQLGIYMAGCVTGPEKIEEVHSESLAVARAIMKMAADGGSI